MADGANNLGGALGLPNEAEEQGIDLRQYWLAVRNRLWLVVLCAMLSTAAMAAWTLRQPHVYRAEAVVAIDTTVPRVLTDVREVVDTGAGASVFGSRSFLDLQLAVLRSRDMAVEVARRLAQDPTFVPMSERERALVWLPGYVQQTLQVQHEKDSRTVRLVAEDLDPLRATILVNATADLFVEQNLTQRQEVTTGAAEWLVGQVDDLQGRLERSEVDLQKFKESHDILSATFEDRQSMTSKEMLALNDAVTAVRLKKLEAEVMRRAVLRAEEEQAAGSGPGPMALPIISKNEAVTSREETVLELKNQRAELLTRYGPLHPKVEAIERQIATAEEEVARQVKLILQVNEQEYQQLVETERLYTQALEKVRSQAFDINRFEVSYNRLKREKDNNEQLYQMVLRRQKEADLAGALKFNNMRVLDRALENRVPVRPNHTRNVAMGFLMGLLLGVALALLIELLDNTVKGQQDVEQKLGLTFLGILPSIRMPTTGAAPTNPADRDLYVHRNPKSPAAECCRAIRTNLLFMGGDEPLRMFVVTSASPSEGKTTTAVSLAIAMAQNGSKVLLMDTDLRRPRVHRAFGISNEVGITSVLVGDVELKDAIKSTEVPGLYVLACGPLPPNPSELLHTQRFQEVLAQVKAQFDRVLLDSPPAGVVADPLVLSSYAQGVVLTVRCKKSTRESVARARRALLDVNARILGVVLNDLDLEKRDGYYTYYASRYGYTYGESPADKAEAPG